MGEEAEVEKKVVSRVTPKKVPLKIKKRNRTSSAIKKVGQPERAARNAASRHGQPAALQHILLRVRSEDGQTVRAHRDVIAAKGSAVFGKMGKRFSTEVVEAINSQIAKGIKTYLFLTTREGWNGEYVTYQCKLKHLEEKLSESRADLVPKYYSASGSLINAWFEICSIDRMSRSDMNRIFVLSSGREIMSVIATSAVAFRVGWPESSQTAIQKSG